MISQVRVPGRERWCSYCKGLKNQKVKSETYGCVHKQDLSTIVVQQFHYGSASFYFQFIPYSNDSSEGRIRLRLLEVI